MTTYGRPCILCGRRISNTESRCAACAGKWGRRKRSCVTCGKQTWTNYCEEHEREQQAARAARQPWRSYDSSAYRRARAAALKRDGYACVVCHRGADTGVPLQTDHIVPLRDGGKNTTDNLQTLCGTCHAAKTRAQRRARRDK